MNYDKSPLIIGGVGGSGTRVVCQIAIDAGFFMGSNLNGALDSLDFQPFYDNYIRELLTDKNPSTIKKNEMKKIFLDCVFKHLSTKNKINEKWGVKIPRFILVLPFLYSLYPDLKFIHVIRDGRDMAFSNNQNQTKLYGDIFCGNQFDFTPSYNLKYWSRVNQKALDYGLLNLKNNYLLVRFEDIVNKPEELIKKIFKFLGSEKTGITHTLSKIITPSTIGRWKTRSDELSQISTFEKKSLERFGYL